MKITVLLAMLRMSTTHGLAPRWTRRVALSSPVVVAAPVHADGLLSTVEQERVAAAKVARTVTAAAQAGGDIPGFLDGPRGLKYQVTKEGSGLKPERGQSVRAEYTLTLGGFAEAGGRVVDSSKGFLKAPFAFYAGVGKVIKAWDLAVMDMVPGEERRLIVPPTLGYGDRGAPPKIPGGATLYFVIELVDLGGPPQLTPSQEAWLRMNPV